jgi:hypothetical protein
MDLIDYAFMGKVGSSYSKKNTLSNEFVSENSSLVYENKRANAMNKL